MQLPPAAQSGSQIPTQSTSAQPRSPSPSRSSVETAQLSSGCDADVKPSSHVSARPFSPRSIPPNSTMRLRARSKTAAERQLQLPAGDNYIAPFLSRPQRSAVCSSRRWRGRPVATIERRSSEETDGRDEQTRTHRNGGNESGDGSKDGAQVRRRCRRRRAGVPVPPASPVSRDPPGGTRTVLRMHRRRLVGAHPHSPFLVGKCPLSRIARLSSIERVSRSEPVNVFETARVQFMLAAPVSPPGAWVD